MLSGESTVLPPAPTRRSKSNPNAAVAPAGVKVNAVAGPGATGCRGARGAGCADAVAAPNSTPATSARHTTRAARLPKDICQEHTGRFLGAPLMPGSYTATRRPCSRRKTEQSPKRTHTTALDDQQQRSAALRWLLLVCNCERVRVTAGGDAGAWDGDARFAGVLSTAATESRSARRVHRESRKSPTPRISSDARRAPLLIVRRARPVAPPGRGGARSLRAPRVCRTGRSGGLGRCCLRSRRGG